MAINRVFIDAGRTGYDPDQIHDTMTVGDLIAFLEQNFSEDARIYLRHDGGYTYGGITERDFEEVFVNEDDGEEISDDQIQALNKSLGWG